MISTLILSTIITLATAQQVTMTVPYVFGDANSVAASVVGANKDATTFALACMSADCGLFPKNILVVGRSTYHVDMSDPNTDFTATQDCVLASSSAVCKETAGGSEANFPGSSTTTYEGTEIGKLTLTVTAGTEELVLTGSVAGSSSAIASQTAARSVPSSASTASVTPMPGSGSAAASSSASRTGSAPAQASTAGAAVNGMVFGGGFVGIAACVFGGLLL
ncbi:uncharacterized protein EKO05_0011228 [Ascochyta rabiei]|uniref:Uncharacterized protein n=1 Tax=Didymella rabiei TaxID=5454 RepID=A0A163E7H6_DIDRA|nr:uncharacterized protein EKO05_0011228 [Ascochyta rabiei]KZM23556.1 hypothetical protein ST47_g5333 [Ascochyta rabiei]UPX21022.1 hypothetical protein EKO05_0011228 [Ascochyta rabiei]